MRKYNLTTETSSINKFSLIVIFLILLLILFWNIYILYYFGIVFSSLCLFLIYLGVFKKSNKNKEIKFDEEYIYFDDNIISISDIISIKRGKIEYLSNGSIESLLFEFNYLEINFYILEDFWNKRSCSAKSK